MISIQLMGGLGNQLFQIFAIIAYAFEHSHQFVFPYSDRLFVGKIRQTYWHNFLTNITLFTTKNPVCKFSNNDLKSFPTIKENGFHYTKIPAVPANNSISLNGYYQSYKYFETYQDKIYAMILLSNQQMSVKTKYGKYFDDGAITISMHFRLGDYKEKQQYHPIMSKEYYEKALSHILTTKYSAESRVRILYFCEAEDNDIVCKAMYNICSGFSQYVNLEIVKVEDGMEDWQQLLLMSCCNDNIIANSSFSWWGAYFNQNVDKCVCYPHIWFGPAMGAMRMEDLFPPSWKKI
jgi:hypothetical protein